MCYIDVIGATMGGIIARKVYYHLMIKYENGRAMFFYDDGKTKISKAISKEQYHEIMDFVVPKLKIIPSSKGGHDPAYKGLELSMNCHKFNWTNKGPGGCVHMGPLFKASTEQQRTYDTIIQYLDDLKSQL